MREIRVRLKYFFRAKELTNSISRMPRLYVGNKYTITHWKMDRSTLNLVQDLMNLNGLSNIIFCTPNCLVLIQTVWANV